MRRVRRNFKPSIETNRLESRALLSDLPVVSPPPLIVFAPPAQPYVITGPIPVPVPAPYPSTTSGPAIVAPVPPSVNLSVPPSTSPTTGTSDPLSSGDPLRIAAPPAYPLTTTPSAPPTPDPLGSTDPLRIAAPPTCPVIPTPSVPTTPDPLGSTDPLRISEPPKVETQDTAPPAEPSYLDQLQELVPYVPLPASTPMPVIP